MLSHTGRVGSDAAPPSDTTSGLVFIRGGSQWRVQQNLDVGIDTESPGRITMEGGRLEVGGLLTVGPRGSLVGIGTVNAPNRLVNAAGFVAPGLSPGTLTVDGNFEQAAAGILEIELAGTSAGQFDLLEVTGNATIGGTVVLQFINRFSSKKGDRFNFLNVGGSIAGEFDNVEVRNLRPGFEYELAPSADGKMFSMTALNDGALYVSKVT